jgi:hypothetical protein
LELLHNLEELGMQIQVLRELPPANKVPELRMTEVIDPFAFQAVVVLHKTEVLDPFAFQAVVVLHKTEVLAPSALLAVVVLHKLHKTEVLEPSVFQAGVTLQVVEQRKQLVEQLPGIQLLRRQAGINNVCFDHVYVLLTPDSIAR